jgi:glycosyltransferase involved in cell wall biosynthesis
MRIALIAHGNVEIPPPAWGAVEGTIWQRKIRLEQLGHTVDVYNTPRIHEVVHSINRGRYDFAHCHNELFAWACNRYLRVPCAMTSHHGGWHRFARRRRAYESFQYLFEETLESPANFVLSERIRDVYVKNGYSGFLRVLPNAVETSEFRFAEQGNGKVLCLGAVTPRKRQAWAARATGGRVPIDFVGPMRDPRFREDTTSKYLGVWDRATLYDRLTDYSCLVLMSGSEAAPKVVLEALAAGLNVVVSSACTANLTDEPFITVLPDRRVKLRSSALVAALRQAVESNARHRPSIRSYAEQHLDYSHQIPRYLELIDAFRAQCSRPSRWRRRRPVAR